MPLGAPYRVFDTREAQWGAVPLGPGQAEDWSFSDFAGSVTIGGVEVGKQLGVIGNLTSAALTRQYPTIAVASFLTVYPSDAAVRPTSANLNMTEGPPVPNMVDHEVQRHDDGAGLQLRRLQPLRLRRLRGRPRRLMSGLGSARGAVPPGSLLLRRDARGRRSRADVRRHGYLLDEG